MCGFSFPGMASVASFAPLMTQLTDVVRSLLQAAGRCGLLVVYALNRRLFQRKHVSAQQLCTSFGANSEKDEQQHQTPESASCSLQQTCSNARETVGAVFRNERSSCQFDAWRPSRRFVVHLFCEARQQQRIYTRQPSQVICSLETGERCRFAIDSDGRFSKLGN